MLGNGVNVTFARTTLLSLLIMSSVVGLGMLVAAGRATPVRSVMFMHNDCDCCLAWKDHLEANGFQVAVRYVSWPRHEEVRSELGIDPGLAACHTSLIGGYVVEGHVPADVISHMLQERPDLVGLGVPGMPGGSPGMEGRGMREQYDILAIHKGGERNVYARR